MTHEQKFDSDREYWCDANHVPDDHGYNEELKYPVFKTHYTDPKVKLEASRFLSQKTFKERIKDSIKDYFNTSSDFKWYVNLESNINSSVDIKIPEDALIIPFTQLEDDYIKPSLRKLRKEFRNTHIQEPINCMSILFEYNVIDRLILVKLVIHG
jgi:hypothetical protein